MSSKTAVSVILLDIFIYFYVLILTNCSKRVQNLTELCKIQTGMVCIFTTFNSPGGKI
jgi:hypothetical protein